MRFVVHVLLAVETDAFSEESAAEYVKEVIEDAFELEDEVELTIEQVDCAD